MKLNLSISSLVLLLATFTNITAIAQTAIITGKVVNETSREPLPSTTVTIKERNQTTTTDVNGNYRFEGVRSGKISVEFSNVAYQVKTLALEVTPGEVLVLDAELDFKKSELGEVVVTSRRRGGTINQVISETRTAKAVISGISKQQIAVSQDNNAAQVMQRVPGITIIENRFVMVRGLSERYNNVMINDVIAPSTEIDKRTFSFDLIPSGAIDRMLIFKSGSPENPGDFAGGVIKIYTNNVVEKPFTEVTLGTGYRSGTTFRPYFQSEGGRFDFLGFDDGTRLLPLNFPSTNTLQSVPRNSPVRERAGRILPNNWDVNESTALPDLKVGLNMGRKFNIGGATVSNITSFEISQTYQNFNRDFFRYFEYDPTRPGILDERFAFLDGVYEKQNRVSLMSNWNISWNARNKIKFSNLFNQIGENETYLRQGEDFIQTLGWRRHYLLGYRQRSIYTGQLDGEHVLSPRRKLHWVAGGSFLYENEPDLRRFRTYAPGGPATPKDEFIMITPPSSNLFDASRYFGELNEFSLSHGLDYTWTWKDDYKGKREVKLGYYVDYRDRVFDSRYMSFLIPGNVSPSRKSFLEGLPLSQIFAPQNISRSDGYVLEEGTRPQDSYTGSNNLNAAYASVVYPMDAFTISGGLRAEYNIQQLNAFRNLERVTVDNRILSLLPFANFIYEINTKSQLRLGYSRTVNRPEFRELAPFNFYDYKLDANRVGDPQLTNATIDNVDLRYEFYPRLGETVSVGAFYKYFNNPIENRGVITTELPTFTYINADYAYNYGVEIELRKSLDQLLSFSKVLSKLQINLNATYIYSVVDLGELASAQVRVRPLQGQSPYIVNAILAYNDLSKKLLISAAYNIFGSRLYIVGDFNNPDIHELPRHSLDLTVTKSFKSFNLKAGIQDVLNYRYRFFQDSDRNGKPNDDIDAPVFTFRRGTLFNASIAVPIGKK